MSFFTLHTEIRLIIYEELLVCLTPIVFEAFIGHSSPLLFRTKRDGLNPALLRVNRKMHEETKPLLYSCNRFQCPDIYPRSPPFTGSAHLAPFLRQIGSQAILIRYLHINFPALYDYGRSKAELHEKHLKNLRLIRDACTGITTLELTLSNTFQLECLTGDYHSATALDLLDVRLKAVQSLKEIVVNIQIDEGKNISDDLKDQMRNCGWAVRITRPKVAKKIWTSDNGLYQFDKEEDYIAYRNDMILRGQGEERDRGIKEYYCRIRDPYGESDYD